MNDTLSKCCSVCGLEKPLTDFHKQSNSKDGRKPACKLCRNAKQNDRRKADPELFKQRKRESYFKHHEVSKKRSRDYQATHADAVRKQKKEYRLKNIDTIRADQRERSRKSRDKKREYDKKYRTLPHVKISRKANNSRREAIRHSLPSAFTTSDWRRCLNYFGGKCAVCGRPPGLWHTIAADHWIPLTDKRENNPGTVPTNIIPLCHSLQFSMEGCNNVKTNRDPIEYLMTTFGKRKGNQILKRVNEYFEWVKGLSNAA